MVARSTQVSPYPGKSILYNLAPQGINLKAAAERRSVCLMARKRNKKYTIHSRTAKTGTSDPEKRLRCHDLTVISRTDNSDGSTTKLLIELQDGQRIETVIMRYGDVSLSSFPDEEKEKQVLDVEGNIKFRSKKRATVCVSSQVGCAMGCTFCATGTMGLLANLSAGEILEQLVHANTVERIRNVVFMGMGEPLDNYPAVLMAVQGMIDTSRFGLSPSRISVSTVGVVPRMLALARDMPDIGLALSLHAPTQELRTQIVPTAKAWNINRIMKAADAFIAQQNANVKSHNRRKHVLIEYVLIADINDSHQVAHQLGELLKGRDVLLNVIPYNPTAVPHDYKPPSQETTRSFVDIVRRVYNVHTLLRQELGQDISSACGQLVIDSSLSLKSSGGCSTDTSKGGGELMDLEDLMTRTSKSGNSSATLRSRSTKTTTTAKSSSLKKISGAGKIAESHITPPSALDDQKRSTTGLLFLYAILGLVILLGVRLLIKLA
ncbi:hypothetical protein BASA60_007543 [Batrachochytrium salamandrivorans]|nr:hypothetical protein BASA60_007543 [Batrachochytrium salamandrivorans]